MTLNFSLTKQQTDATVLSKIFASLEDQAHPTALSYTQNFNGGEIQIETSEVLDAKTFLKSF